MELAVFSEDELQKHLRIVAKDSQMKFQTRQKLRQQEEYLSKLCSINQTNRGCALCLNSFSLFRRPYKCSRCCRYICPKCRKQLLCLLCITQDEVSYKRKEWSILCPYTPGTFGHAKFECKSFKQENEECVEAFAIEEYSIQPDNCSYRHLLVNAVISSMISASKTSITHETSNNSNSTRTNSDHQKPAQVKMPENTVRKKKANCRTVLLRVPRNSLSPKRLQLHQRKRVRVSGIGRPNQDLLVIMSSKIIEAKSGELVRITCVVETENEDFDVKWYHGDEELPKDGRFRALSAGFRQCLEIFDCKTADQGEIMCAAINNFSIASDTVLLNVREEDIAAEEPRFIEPLTANEIDGSLVLKCAITGYPIPYLTFHRKNRRIHTNRTCKIERVNEKWTLTLYNCNVDDEGRYLATARNRVGRTLSCYKVFLKNKIPETYIADV